MYHEKPPQEFLSWRKVVLQQSLSKSIVWLLVRRAQNEIPYLCHNIDGLKLLCSSLPALKTANSHSICIDSLVRKITPTNVIGSQTEIILRPYEEQNSSKGHTWPVCLRCVQMPLNKMYRSCHLSRSQVHTVKTQASLSSRISLL